MAYTVQELAEAKRQIDSILHKLEQALETMQRKEDAGRYRSQITLARRRIAALTLAAALIEREQAAQQGPLA